MKLISILLLSALIQTVSASDKKDCKKACDKCASEKCQEFISPTPLPTIIPTPTPTAPPVSTLDIKILSLNPSSGTVTTFKLGVPSPLKTLFNTPKFTMLSNQDVKVRYSESVAKVDPVTHQLLSTELTASAGYQSLTANVPAQNQYTMSVPLYYGVNTTYRLKVCIYAVDIVDPAHPDIPDANSANNCASGEYLVID